MYQKRARHFRRTSDATSIEHGQYVEYNPIAAIALGQPIEFNISGGGQNYLDLANTQLYVKAQILRQNGNPLLDADDVGPVNLFLHFLFSEVDISLNDTQITSSNNTYSYRAYLETLLSYGPDTKAFPTIVVDVLQRHGRSDGRNRGRCRRCPE